MSFADWARDTWSEITSGGAAETETYNGNDNSTTTAAAATSNDDNDSSSSPATLGSVSQTGQYAGDGFEWVQNDNTNALTRVYTGANEGAGLGQEVIAAGTADNATKAIIADISLNEGSAFANSQTSATDGSGVNLVRSDDNQVGSDSYADQVGTVDYTPTITYDSTQTGAENTAATPAAVPVVEEAPSYTFNPTPTPGGLGSLRPVSRPTNILTPREQALVAAYNAVPDSDELYTPDSETMAAVLKSQNQENLTSNTSAVDYDSLGDLGVRDELNMSVGERTAAAALRDGADVKADYTGTILPAGIGSGSPLPDNNIVADASGGWKAFFDNASAQDIQDLAGSGIQLEKSYDAFGNEYATADQAAQADIDAEKAALAANNNIVIANTPDFVPQFPGDVPAGVTPLVNTSFAGDLGDALAAGTADLLPGLALQGSEQLVSAGLETGRDLNLPGFGADFVTDPMLKYRQAGLGDLSGLDRISQEQELYRTGLIEEVGPAAIRLPNAPTELETFLQNAADTQFAELDESIAAMSPEAQKNLSSPAVTVPNKFGYSEVGNQVDPAFASALGEDPNKLDYSQYSIDPRATAMQAFLTAPTALATVAASFVNPAIGGILGGGLAGGEGQRASNTELAAALSSGELQNTDAYKAYATATDAAPQYASMTQAEKDSLIVSQMQNDVSKGLVPLNLLSGAISAATPGLLKSGIPGKVVSPVIEGVEEGLLEKVLTNASLANQTGLERLLDPEEVLSEGLVGAISAAPASVGASFVSPGSPVPPAMDNTFVVDSATEGAPAASNVQSSYDEVPAAEQLMVDQLPEYNVDEARSLASERLLAGNSDIVFDADNNILTDQRTNESFQIDPKVTPILEATTAILLGGSPPGSRAVPTPVSATTTLEELATPGQAGPSRISFPAFQARTAAINQKLKEGSVVRRADGSVGPATTPVGIAPPNITTSAIEENIAKNPLTGLETLPVTDTEEQLSLDLSSAVDPVIPAQSPTMPAASDLGPEFVAPATAPPVEVTETVAKPAKPVIKAREVLTQYNEDIDTMGVSSARLNRLVDAALIRGIINNSKKGSMVNITKIAETGNDAFDLSNGYGDIADPKRIIQAQKRLEKAGILGPADSNGDQELLAEVAAPEGLTSNTPASVAKSPDDIIADQRQKSLVASSTGTVVTKDANGGATVERDLTPKEIAEAELQTAADVKAVEELYKKEDSETAIGPYDEDEDEEEDVIVELEEEEEEEVVTSGTDDIDDTDGTDIFVPVTTSTDEDGNTINECPEGYEMVQTEDGPMCQKITKVVSSRQRAGAGTQRYTGGYRTGRGPGQARNTTTSTKTETVSPTTRIV